MLDENLGGGVSLQKNIEELPEAMRPRILDARRAFERDVLIDARPGRARTRQRPPANGGARGVRRLVLQGPIVRPPARGHDRRRQRPRVRLPLSAGLECARSGLCAALDRRPARHGPAPGHPARQLLQAPGPDPERRRFRPPCCAARRIASRKSARPHGHRGRRGSRPRRCRRRPRATGPDPVGPGRRPTRAGKPS